MQVITEEEKRIKFDELQKALESSGWSDWTVIAFNPIVNEYKIFSHLSTEEDSFLLLEFILQSMLDNVKKRNKIHEEIGGSC